MSGGILQRREPRQITMTFFYKHILGLSFGLSLCLSLLLAIGSVPHFGPANSLYAQENAEGSGQKQDQNPKADEKVEQKADGNWIDLFNGENLDGWTVKIAGHPVGDNYADTFRVEDGILKCEYDDYGDFEGRFGHLYSEIAYSHYKLRMDYRFEGRQLPDAPHYVDLNSGVMLHSQSPQSMSLEQEFPASLEMQFLADLGKGKRQTGNVCTPGTHLVYQDKLTKKHIVKSTGPTLPPDRWVSVEMEVRGNDLIIYRVEGKEVLRYTQPQLDPNSKEAKSLVERGADIRLSYGHIALQAEAQRVWFRNIRLLPLDSKAKLQNELEPQETESAIEPVIKPVIKPAREGS